MHDNHIHLMAMCFATGNRVPTVELEIYRNNTVPATSLPLDTWIAQPADYHPLRKRMVVLVTRLLVKYFPFFQEHFSDVVVKHIPHEHSAVMSQKSIVVSSTLNYH